MEPLLLLTHDQRYVVTERDTTQCPPIVTTETLCLEMDELQDVRKKLDGAELEGPQPPQMCALRSEETARGTMCWPPTEMMVTLFQMMAELTTD